MKNSIRLLGVLLVVLSCTAQVFAAGPDPYDYAKMLGFTRELLSRKPVRKFLKEVFADELVINPELVTKFALTDKIRDMTESQFMEILRAAPQSWDLIDEYIKKIPEIAEDDASQEALRKEFKGRFREILELEVPGPKKGTKITLHEKIALMSDPTNPFVFETKNGNPAYENMQLFADHLRIDKTGKKIPPANLKKVIIDFIDGAEKEFVMNVFDFDLEDVAEAIIRAKKRGVSCRVGIDSAVVEERPGVKIVFDKLKKAKVTVFAVDSVGLNHMKLFSRDWSIKGKGSVVFSSGNMTQSCIGPGGDLEKEGLSSLPKMSVPNANHMVTFESDIAAQLVDHQLTKVLDMGLRGADVPLGGAFNFPGGFEEGIKEANYALVAFSPHGGLGNLNSDIVARGIRTGGCDIKMIVFALSSDEIYQGLLQKAKDCRKAKTPLNFEAVGDGPFATADWSLLLKMSCLDLDKTGPKKVYRRIPDCEFEKAMGKEAHEAMSKKIMVGGPEYGNHSFKMPDGTSRDVTAKIHSKVLVQKNTETGGYAIIGNSFNFSAAANDSNNEQMLLVRSRQAVEDAESMIEGLKAGTRKTVTMRAEQKNLAGDYKESHGLADVTDEEAKWTEKTDETARRLGLRPAVCDDTFKTKAKVSKKGS